MDRRTMRQLARRIDAQQLIGKIVCRALGAILRASPLAAAESTERRILRAGVARDSAELFGWNEDAIPAAVLNLQVVALIPLTATAHHAQESPKPVIDMHQEVAWCQPLRRFPRDAAAVHRHAANTRCAEEFTIGDYGQRIHTALKPPSSPPCRSVMLPGFGSRGIDALTGVAVPASASSSASRDACSETITTRAPSRRHPLPPRPSHACGRRGPAGRARRRDRSVCSWSSAPPPNSR